MNAFYSLLFFTGILFIGCSDNDQKASSEEEPDMPGIYHDYKVTAEEDQFATVMLQFRKGGRNRKAVSLPDSIEVWLDDQQLRPDSTRFTGVYYELVQPVDEFNGTHTIQLRSKNKVLTETSFNFKPFHLSSIPEEIKKQPFDINLQQFPKDPTRLQLVMTDTSFESPDVNREVLVSEAQLKIDSSMLKKITTGMIVMEIFREDEEPIKVNGRRSGHLLLSYGLRRHFDLVK